MHWRTIISLIFCVFAVGMPAEDLGLRASKPAVRKQIVSAIEGQLAAFRKHDVLKAYAYAATALQAQKPLAQFVAIVKISYPEIWWNHHAEFGIVRDDGNTATVLVHVFADKGDASYDYTLVKEDKAWRVHDVLRHDPTIAPDKV